MSNGVSNKPTLSYTYKKVTLTAASAKHTSFTLIFILLQFLDKLDVKLDVVKRQWKDREETKIKRKKIKALLQFL